MLVLSLWGEPFPPLTPILPVESISSHSPNLPRTFLEPGIAFQAPSPILTSRSFVSLSLPSYSSTIVLSPRGSSRRSKHHGQDWEATGAEL